MATPESRPLDAASTPRRPGAGMVKAGWILLGLMAAATIALPALGFLLVYGIGSDGGAAIIFVAAAAVFGALWLVALVAFYLPGIALLVLGRAKQRGPVAWQGLALTWAMAGIPVVAVAVFALTQVDWSPDTPGAVWLTITSVIGVLLLLVPISAAWAIWGRRLPTTQDPKP